MYFFSNSELYLKNTLFQQKSRSMNEVSLKYKQTTFLFFFSFYTSFILLFSNFTESILLLDFKDLKYKLRILKVYLKYTSDAVLFRDNLPLSFSLLFPFKFYFHFSLQLYIFFLTSALLFRCPLALSVLIQSLIDDLL